MTLEYAFELFGTFFFAISGALAIQDKEHDWFGAGFTGFVTAIGGGSLRDMILGSYPLVWVRDIRFVYAIIVGVMVAILFYRYLIRLRRTFFLFDTLGIGFFTVLGVEKSLALGMRPEIAAIMGMFSAVMGGVIRDTLTNETPVIFRKEVYATACLAGAVCYLLLDRFTAIDRNANLILSAGLVIAIRIVAVKFRLALPELK